MKSLFTDEQRQFFREKLAKQKQDPAFKQSSKEGMLKSSKVGVMTPAKVDALKRANVASHTIIARKRAVESMPKGFYKTQGAKNKELLAKTWLLVSPLNIIHRFKNLSDFVRQNETMFNAEDVIWKTPYICRAIGGLSKLRPSRKKPDASWKGWRWLSLEERLNSWCGLIEPQLKPAKTPTYRERRLAGEVKEKPRKRINPIAKKRLSRHRSYAAWIKAAMIGQRCAFTGCHDLNLEPHHPHGRNGDNLFKVIPCCSAHHRWIHEHPAAAFAAGWLTPAYRGYAPNPNHPQPFTLLPRP